MCYFILWISPYFHLSNKREGSYCLEMAQWEFTDKLERCDTAEKCGMKEGESHNTCWKWSKGFEYCTPSNICNFLSRSIQFFDKN